MNKKLTAILTLVLFLFTLMPVATFAADTHKHCVCGGNTNIGDHTPHSDITFTEWTSTDSMPDTTGNYVLMNDVTISDNLSWMPSDDTVLCLNGHTLTLKAVSAHYDFTLCDCTGNGKIIGSGGSVYTIAMAGSATFTMYGGTVFGGDGQSGVYVYGCFNMYGGTITNGKNNKGGGVFLEKISYAAQMTMYGGTISGNQATDSGGGVYIGNGTTFTMNGGTVSNNTSNGFGGGVLNDGTFNMYSGTIDDNYAENQGGGVYVSGNAAFDMRGGTITRNTTNWVREGTYGGGVFVFYGGTMTVSGASVITGNTTTVTSNLHLQYNETYGQALVTVSEMKHGANIGISMYEYGVFSVGGKNYSQYFTADNTDYVITVDGENLKLIAHTHAYNELKWNETEHWCECSCGVEQSGSRVGHSGGTATCTAKAVCATCNVEYGDKLGHDYVNSTIWINTNPDGHYKQCARCTVTDSANTEVHSYDVHPDVTCNVCGYERSLEHDFANGAWVTTDAAYHWKACKDCTTEDMGNKMPHEYTNDCDTDCNICGYTRTVTPPAPTGGSGEFTGDYNYPITISPNDNGSAILSDPNAVAGESVTITTKPNSGYGAVDVIVTDEDGNEIEITALGNGQYTFVMPEGGADVQVVYKPAITLTVGSLYIDVFGKLVKNDVTAILTPEGRMMLPIRVIAEALGADVDWDADTQKVTITKGDTVIEIFIGSDYAIVNGEKVALDSAAFIKDNRTYLPVRFVSEYLGADVNWYADSKTVIIVPYDVK